MKIKGVFNKAVEYLRDSEIDIRIRMLFLLQYAVLAAAITGTVAMLTFDTSQIMLIPNYLLLAISILGLYLSHFKKKYELTANLIIISCAYVVLPFMFFSSGGNKSGMPLWFTFAVVFGVLMAKNGAARIFLPTLTVVINAACMLVGYYHPELVMELGDESAVFTDSLQSYIIVSLMICACMGVYLSTYDKQQMKLEEQRRELNLLINTDALTGVRNRHAYYDAVEQYKDSEAVSNLVLVAMDVNGLKNTNDTRGHAEGDGLIIAAANIMNNEFSKYGTVYRTGGDEFMAILFCNDNMAQSIEEHFKSVAKDFTYEGHKKVSIACGFALWNQNKVLDFFELEKLADVKMYQNKREYYVANGKDRRK